VCVVLQLFYQVPSKKTTCPWLCVELWGGGTWKLEQLMMRRAERPERNKPSGQVGGRLPVIRSLDASSAAFCDVL
jgi:hypothetical protein